MKIKNKCQNIAILGAGRIGSYIAAKFIESKTHKIHLLARGNYADIEKSGIILTNGNSNKVIKEGFTLYNSISDLPPCNLIIMAVPTSQNSNLLSTLNLPLYNSSTKIVTLQNGLLFEDEITKRIPKHCTLYSGTCWIKISQIEPGHIRHDFGNNIKLGRYMPNQQNVQIQKKDQEIQKIFKEIGFDTDLIVNIQSVQLTKTALNLPFFTIVTKTGYTIPEILASSTLNIERMLLQEEIINTAQSIGSLVDKVLIDKITDALKTIPIKIPSSRQKIVENMKKETLGFIEKLIHFAHKHNHTLPLIEMEYRKLQSI